MKKKPLKIISLFAGAGGMDLGFKNAGFDIMWANDFDPDSLKHIEEILVIILFLEILRK